MKLSENGNATEGDVNETPRRRHWQAEHLDDHALELLERDREAFLQQSLSTPCLNALKSAQGSWIEDVQGRRYLDFHGNMVHQVGYAHPHVVARIKAQIDELSFCPRRYTNDRAIELSEKLAEIAPGQLSKVLFAPGGSAAIGIALKLARIATGRYKTISMWDAFHGASLDAASVGGEERFRRDIGPLLPGSEHVPPPDARRCPLGCGAQCSFACLKYLEYVLEKEGDVAAVIAEPMRCTTVVPPPPGYWKRVRQACDIHGALLIFDEIPTALGRTGKMFSCEWSEVVPDILVIGKGLGGGVMPLAAVIANVDLDIADEYSIGHYTHEKNPVSCAAGLATLEVIESERLVERSRLLGEQGLVRLQNFAKSSPRVLDVRGLGLLFGVEMSDSSFAEQCMYDCLAKGLSFKVSSGTVLTLAPPLNITEEDLERAFMIIESSIRALD
jgi:4-aminobutyrate aminotransferase